MIHEMGGSTAQYAPERVAMYDRAMIYSGLGQGGIGVDLWCYTDAAPEQFHKVPYLRTPQETRWGMTTWDRQDKPLAKEFKRYINQPDNFFKHADNDPDGTQELDPRWSQGLLFEAARKY